MNNVKEPTALANGRYLIAVLTLAYTASFIDRQVLNLLIGPLKAEFALSDTRLSLLQGSAFTVAYVLFAPVFGRCADISSRRTLLILSVLVWSLGTVLCGLSHEYWQLFVARSLVGAAEACLTPAAFSMIADQFSARQIPRALSIYLIAPFLGGGLALLFGGMLLGAASRWSFVQVPLLAGMHPWQMVFVAVGIPGLLIAVLLLWVQEPDRREISGSGATDRMTAREAWRSFRARRRFYGNFYAGMALLAVTLYLFPAWIPTMLIRNFHVSAVKVGFDYGVLVLISGCIAMVISPWVANLVRRSGRRDALLLVPCASAVAALSCAALLPLATTYEQVLALATAASFAYSLPQSLASSSLQIVTPSRMRGIAASLYGVIIILIGLGAAPTILALLTDRFFKDEQRVGDSLAITCCVASVLSAICLWQSLIAYRAILDETRAENAVSGAPNALAR